MLTALIPVAILTLLPAPAPIVLDGEFDDWDAVPVVLTDPTGDAADAAIDLGAIRVAHDADWIYLQIDLGRTVNSQRLPGQLYLDLDADDDPETGDAGFEVSIAWSPPGRRPDERGMGMGLDCTTPNGKTVRVSAYELDVMIAPTYADQHLEMRVRRGQRVCGSRPLLTAPRLRGRLRYVDADGGGDVTDVFTAALTDAAPAVTPLPSSTLRRAPGTDIRVLTWNVERGSLLKDPRSFARILRAADPDVILFQEFSDKDDAGRVRRVLEDQVPDAFGRPWQVNVGRGGGNLRCAVASRLGMVVPPKPGVIDDPERSGFSLRTATGVVPAGGRRLLVLSAHLRCCGHIGSKEDLIRIRETSLIRNGVEEASATLGADAIIMAGDLNLVGSRDPLGILIHGLDRDGSDLEVANPLQIDAASMSTWRRDSEAFVPGRLDFVMYSGTQLRVCRAFVFDAADLDDAARRTHDLSGRETDEASDHLPVVVDFAWRVSPTP